MTTPDRLLLGRSVVVCRSPVEAEALLRQLDAAGASARAVPLQCRVGPSDGGSGLEAAIERVDRFGWLVATSANGVRSIVDALGSRALPAGLHLAAVGPATRAAFEAAGHSVDFVPRLATAAGLGAELPDGSAGPPGRVLAALGEAAGDELSAALTARGWAVERVDAYRMAPIEPSAEDRQAVAGADAVVLTAPSIVDRFLACFGSRVTSPLVVSIGPRTTTRIAERGLDGQASVIEADSPTPEAIVEALLALVAAD